MHSNIYTLMLDPFDAHIYRYYLFESHILIILLQPNVILAILLYCNIRNSDNSIGFLITQMAMNGYLQQLCHNTIGTLICSTHDFSTQSFKQKIPEQ